MNDLVQLMRPEMLLLTQVVFLLLFDLFAPDRARRHTDAVACALFLASIAVGFLPSTTGEAFGGMFTVTAMTQVVKNVLSIGLLLVFLQSRVWLSDERTSFKKAEFYILTLLPCSV